LSFELDPAVAATPSSRAAAVETDGAFVLGR
jgi:hypothetical protein